MLQSVSVSVVEYWRYCL